jgi:prophage maintenance system killer protein
MNMSVKQYQSAQDAIIIQSGVQPFLQNGITKIPEYLLSYQGHHEGDSEFESKASLTWAETNLLPRLAEITLKDIQLLHEKLYLRVTTVAGARKGQFRYYYMGLRLADSPEACIEKGYVTAEEINVIKSTVKQEHICIRDILQQPPHIIALFKKTYYYPDLVEFQPVPADGTDLQNKLAEKVEELVQQLRTKMRNNEHPIKIAAFAYERLVGIHPFCDGNGRTSRCLMNLILMRGGYLPITTDSDDEKYNESIIAVQQKKDSTAFLKFLCKRVKAQTDLVKASLRS